MINCRFHGDTEMTNEINPVLEGDYLPIDKFSVVDRAPIVVSHSTEPADVIKTTQSIRLQILAQRLQKGVTDDLKELNTDLQLLRDLDQAALTTRKIDVEERAVNESERVSEQTNALLKMLDGKNPFAVDLTTGSIRSDLTGRPRDAALPEPVIVPGHMRQGTENLNYADYVTDPDDDSDRLGDGDEEEEESP